MFLGSSYLKTLKMLILMMVMYSPRWLYPPFFGYQNIWHSKVFLLKNNVMEINWYKANNLDPWNLNLFFLVLQMVNTSLIYRFSIVKQRCYWIGTVYIAIRNWKWSWNIYKNLLKCVCGMESNPSGTKHLCD